MKRLKRLKRHLDRFTFELCEKGFKKGLESHNKKWKSKVSRLKGIRHLLFSNNKWLSWKISKLLECTEAKSKKREKCLTSFHVKMLALFFLLDGSRGIFTFFGMCLLFLELNWYFFLTFISSFACLFFHYLLYSFLSLRELFSFSSPSCNLSYLVPVRYFFYLFFSFSHCILILVLSFHPSFFNFVIHKISMATKSFFSSS